MSDAAWIFLTFATAPIIVVAGVAMFRGYHVLVKLYRPGADDGHGHPHSDHHRGDR